MSELYSVSVVNHNKNLKFEKDDYQVLVIEVNFVGFTRNYFIYFHQSDLEMKKQLLSPLQETNTTRRSLDCIKTNSGLSIEDANASIRLGEVTNFEDLPRKILVCSSFIVEEELDKKFKSQGLIISNNTVRQNS